MELWTNEEWAMCGIKEVNRQTEREREGERDRERTWTWDTKREARKQENKQIKIDKYSKSKI